MNSHSINYRTTSRNLIYKYLPISSLNIFLAFFVFFNLSFLINATIAQTTTDSILSNYRNFKQQQIDSIVNFNSKSKKYAWLNLIPAPTWSTRTGVGLSVNVSSLSNYYQNNKANQIELERLKFQMNNSLETQLLALETKLNEIYSDIVIYRIQVENFKNEESIYKIEKGKYKNNKSTLKDWLTYNNGYLASQLNITTRKENLKNRIISLSRQIKNAEWASALINSI